MRIRKSPFFMLLVVLVACTSTSEEKSSLRLWYDEPAVEWTEALPIGNGRIGAMVYGGTAVDHVQFNEETLWTGRPRNYSRESASEHLDEIRDLLAAGKQVAAEALAGREFMGVRSNEAQYPEQKAAWLHKVRQPEHLIYAAPEFDVADWKTLEVPSKNGWEEAGLDAVDGVLWFRFSFDLPKAWEGMDLIMELGRIRETDFTYFNGAFIGSETDRKKERVYEVPAEEVRATNVIAVQVVNYQNKGGFVGLKEFDRPMVVYPKDRQRTAGIFLNTEWKYFEQDLSPPEFPKYEEAYQPFGDLWFEFDGHDAPLEYSRELDIENAQVTTSYQIGDTQFTRTYFVNAPSQVMVAKFEASQPGKLNLSAKITTPHRKYTVTKVDDQTLKLETHIHNGALYGVSYLKVMAGSGSWSVTEDGITVRHADEVVFYLTAATNFVSYRDVSGRPEAVALDALHQLAGKDFGVLQKEHVQEYQQHFSPFFIDLGKGANEALPTDERIELFRTSNDPSLLALYVQYARYLMISSSRPGTQPPNLQGIWNDQLTPPWGSKYTTNINLEMNYWPVEALNLSSMHEPLFDLIEEVAAQGSKTARDHYDANGWVLHHNTDIWRATAPVNNANHGIWVTGGAWLCHHLWNHFLYTRDTVFLKTRAYPLMKGAATFFVDFLSEDPETGYLISTPSNSPENGGLVAAPSMDHQLIRDLFQNSIAAACMLKEDEPFVDTLQGLLPRLAPHQIGQHGQLQEWLVDVDDPENKHRHVSHLWAVYPGSQITPETPDLYNAAKQSLLFRGDEGTGWSLAWKINLWARFHEGDHAWELIKALLSPAWTARKGRGGSYKNLFDAHPPFQIDGNFGAAAGVAEMIVQNQGDQLVLLPALPHALPNGQVRGLKAKGGLELGVVWENHQLMSLSVWSPVDTTCVFVYENHEIPVTLISRETIALNDFVHLP